MEDNFFISKIYEYFLYKYPHFFSFFIELIIEKHLVLYYKIHIFIIHVLNCVCV